MTIPLWIAPLVGIALALIVHRDLVRRLFKPRQRKVPTWRTARPSPEACARAAAELRGREGK